MAGISAFLPKPKNTHKFASSIGKDSNINAMQSSKSLPSEPAAASAGSLTVGGSPPYRLRGNWTPKTLSDYGDGGAFPEIHMAQYPRGIGLKKTAVAAGNTIALRVDESGSVRYDAIARIGKSANQIVHTSLESLKPIKEGANFEKPPQEVIEETTQRTRMALEKIVGVKMASVKTTHVAKANNEATYVKYTPQNPELGIESRIVKMVDMPVDPLEPPRFKHKKVPRGPGSPPAPVLHSPPRKVDAEEQKAWMIPPCVSNWKNARGFTIPLDKRLAADGRDLQEVKINDNFAKVAEALYIADRHAREEVSARAKMQKRLAEKEKESKESYLRELAQRAKEEREEIESIQRRAAVESPKYEREPSPSMDSYSDDGHRSTQPERQYEGEADSVRKDFILREKLRKEREREIQRQMRLGNTGKSRQDRDISEKIALGIAKPTVTADTLYDQRLFNQTEGISSGFATDDNYNLYDKPLFNNVAAIYKPKIVADEQLDVDSVLKANRFVPDRGFKGTEEVMGDREGPVRFKKADEGEYQKRPNDEQHVPEDKRRRV